MKSWLEDETGKKSKKVTFHTITFFDQPPIPHDDTTLEGLTKMCFSTVTYQKTDKTSMYSPCFCHNNSLILYRYSFGTLMLKLSYRNQKRFWL